MQGKIRITMPMTKLADIHINYRVKGEGEPLVMIMGFSSSMIGWYYQARFFRRHYRVVTFDNRGVGGSDKPQGPYSTRLMAEDIIRLMDNLGIEKANIIGASMGGMIAQEFAINHPERVTKLVLACTYACQDETSGSTPEMAKLALLPPEKMVSAMIGLAFNRPLYRFIFGLLGRLWSRFMATSDTVGIDGQREACVSHNTLERLHLITANTLVIVGTGDRLIKPVSSEVIANRIPGSRLVKVEGGSHTFMVEMRDVFNREVLNFLTS
jgi:pimeloyl-ACP methyl ester carboxylesterase